MQTCPMETTARIFAPRCNSDKAEASLRVVDDAGSLQSRRTAWGRTHFGCRPHRVRTGKGLASMSATIRSNLIARVEGFHQEARRRKTWIARHHWPAGPDPEAG